MRHHLIDCSCLGCILARVSERKHARRRMIQRMDTVETPIHPNAAHTYHGSRTGACVDLDGTHYQFCRCDCGQVLWCVPVS